MTKKQRVILEQAYVNVLVCPIQQGDSWGLVDEEDLQNLFDDLGNKVRALQTMGDAELLKMVYETCDVEGYRGGLSDEELLAITQFDTFNELNAYVERIDGGDLQSIAVLTVAHFQASK